jgi:hypothetical protein
MSNHFDIFHHPLEVITFFTLNFREKTNYSRFKQFDLIQEIWLNIFMQFSKWSLR